MRGSSNFCQRGVKAQLTDKSSDNGFFSPQLIRGSHDLFRIFSSGTITGGGGGGGGSNIFHFYVAGLEI